MVIFSNGYFLKGILPIIAKELMVRVLYNHVLWAAISTPVRLGDLGLNCLQQDVQLHVAVGYNDLKQFASTEMELCLILATITI